MTTPDDLNTLLPDLEGPVAPDPEFAARLRNRFVSATGYQPTRQPRLIPVQTGNASPTPIRASRRRWLDLAAVAVLFLSMIGGIARVTNHGATPTPAIQAPQTDQPVMVGRSAAGDGQINGPAPNAARYERQWTTEADTTQPPTHGAATYGGLVFRVPSLGNEGNLADLLALDLYTGAEVWRRPVDVSVTATVTTQGVIVGLSNGTNAFRLALLDLETGVPIWTSDQTVASPLPAHDATLIVAERSIFFSVSDGSIYALDLFSGETQWMYAYPRIPPLGASEPFCFDADNCVARSDTDISIVFANGRLYVSDLTTSDIFALSPSTAEVLWSVSTVERSGSSNVSYASLIAVEQGVIVALQDAEASNFTPVVYWGLWSANDGSEVWEGTLALGDPQMVSNGSSLFALFKDRDRNEGVCCDIAEVDVATGAIKWSREASNPTSLEGYLADESTLITRTLGSGESLQGLSTRTHQIDWTLSLSVNDCYTPVFPISSDGVMACLSNLGRIAVYRPITETAMPAAATPIATEQSIMANGSAAMDGSWPGPAPTSGDYRLRWRGQAPAAAYTAPFQDKIYQYIARVGPTNTGGIVAYDAQTGAEHWYQPVTSNFAFAVTSAGIVAGIPDSFDSEGSPAADAGLWDFHVVLLDLDTGQPIWRSAETYLLASQPFSMSAQIVGDTILFVDRQLTLVALDLATGQERWRAESSELPAPDCICFVAGPAISGGTVYFHNPVTEQIVAVSLSTGVQKWAVDDPAGPVVLSSGGTVISPSIALAAVEQGVVVNTWWIPRDESHGYFGVLSAADGSPMWEWDSDKPVQAFARFGDALIVLTRNPGEADWHLERVELATGQILKTSSHHPGRAPFLNSLPEADLVLVKGWSSETVGIDPVTLEITWTQPAIEDCAIRLPVLPDGGLACSTNSGLAIYEPVSGSATPAGNSDEETSIPVENGDFLVITEPGGLLLEEPTVGAEVAEVYDEGTMLQYVGKASVGADGTIWYMVRNPKTARAGWIPAACLKPEK